jgi:hypothetical protein
MARTATAPAAGQQTPSAVILFGLGDDRRPRAAHFPAKQADLAVKAASAMGFNVLKVAGADQVKIAAKLPAGGSMRTAVASCRSYARTSTPSWQKPLRTALMARRGPCFGHGSSSCSRVSQR